MFKLFLVLLLIGLSTCVPMNQPFSGHFTYYNDAGIGACGNWLDASSQMLVAASHEYFTTPNPNNDPICGVCLKVDYRGKSITVPVKDKCPSCPRDHMDLSLPAFRALENPDVGNAYGATFTFVNC
uniref:RlpA-like protein double-psi beta-barrel domain-containing protein n=1 Tax=Panagrolaimus sp. JU765 TaxID=591449 RepID=A0AC34RP81_9BILA